MSHPGDQFFPAVAGVEVTTRRHKLRTSSHLIIRQCRRVFQLLDLISECARNNVADESYRKERMEKHGDLMNYRHHQPVTRY